MSLLLGDIFELTLYQDKTYLLILQFFITSFTLKQLGSPKCNFFECFLCQIRKVFVKIDRFCPVKAA